ncbi:MAG TPA: PDZ domain-containing protein [Pirellulales bacterium]|nr:PDZ domain-containing protein [Pirellulales bacterium]
MFSKLSQTGFALAIVAGMLPMGKRVVQAQTFRQEARMRARADRQIGRAEARTFGNFDPGYYAYPGYSSYYVPGGYYAYGPVYGGPGYYGPGYAADGYARPPYPRQRAYLGITMSETPDGVVRISGVRSNSPAAEAGLRVGDVILALNGREIYSAQDVSRMVARHVPGDAVALDIDRNGRNDRVEALLTGQTGQFVAGAPVGGGFVPDYVEPTFDQPGRIPPMQARRPGNAAIDPNLDRAY